MHAYLWDRYYGVCLAKYQHGDVVNSVAFNSRDSEMLVTTSDDYTIKVSASFFLFYIIFLIRFFCLPQIWRSTEKVKLLNAVEIQRATEFRRKN